MLKTTTKLPIGVPTTYVNMCACLCAKVNMWCVHMNEFALWRGLSATYGMMQPTTGDKVLFQPAAAFVHATLRLWQPKCKYGI